MERNEVIGLVPAPANKCASILVIDREISGHSSFLDMFQSYDCQVVTCSTVRTYMALEDQRHYDIVIVEIDVFDPETLSNTVALRRYFGAGEVPWIVGIATFAPGEFISFAQKAGCDECVLITDLPKVLRRLLPKLPNHAIRSRIH